MDWKHHIATTTFWPIRFKIYKRIHPNPSENIWLDVKQQFVKIFIFKTYPFSVRQSENIPVLKHIGYRETKEFVIVFYRLSKCGVTDEGCAALASALRSNPSHLRKLDLNGNKLGDSKVKLLFAVLESPHCNLEGLW